MAAGLPLISSYINGMKDYTADGVSGCCNAKARDIQFMQNAIFRMHIDTNLCKKCGFNNQETVRQFALQTSINAVAQIYNNL